MTEQNIKKIALARKAMSEYNYAEALIYYTDVFADVAESNEGFEAECVCLLMALQEEETTLETKIKYFKRVCEIAPKAIQEIVDTAENLEIECNCVGAFCAKFIPCTWYLKQRDRFATPLEIGMPALYALGDAIEKNPSISSLV